MDLKLNQKRCVPCEGGLEPLKGEKLADFGESIHGHWIIEGEHHLSREFGFKDFKEALTFANSIGEIAEEEGHHPDILVSWGKVGVTIWTHAIDGLSENDFILAAKIDEL